MFGILDDVRNCHVLVAMFGSSPAKAGTDIDVESTESGHNRSVTLTVLSLLQAVTVGPPWCAMGAAQSC